MPKPTYKELEQKIHELESREKTSSQKDVEICRQADIVLAESEAKYKTLFENMAQGAFYQRSDGVLIDCNSAVLEMFGVSKDQFMGKTSMDPDWHVIAEDGSELSGDQHPSMVALTSGQPVHDFLVAVYNPKKKDYVWLNINAIPQFKEGESAPYQVFVTLHDITERKQAEDRLKVSDQKNKAALNFLQLIIETIPVRLFWKDLDSRVLGCNKLFAQDAGRKSTDELIGSDDYTWGWKEQAEQYRADDLDVMTSGQAKLKYEEPQTTPEGHHITLLTSKVPIRDENNEIIGLLGTYEDITQRKQIEAEREAAIEFLRIINESRGIRELISAATAFLQKQTGCEAVGIRLQEENDYPYYETRGFSGEFVLAENFLCTRDEAGRPVYDSTGNPVLECMCGNVICGRFDPSKPFFTAQGSFWCNCTTELLAATSAGDRQSRTRNRCNGEGYESVALIPLHLGTKCLGLLQLNDRSKGRFKLETITLLERLAGYLAVALAKFRAEEQLQALKDELEITVEKRTHELQETQKQYLHAEKLSAIGKLSASIAHEFNNPLQSVMTVIRGIERYVRLEKKEAELVDMALQECQRMKKMILCLQDFERPSSGRKTLMNVHNSLDAIMILQKSDFNSRQILVVRNYAENLPQIMAVPDQIKQVFLNLLTNAADACRNHGGVITVSTRQENDRVAVAIRDTGIGIKPEEMEHIFRPFFTTKPEVKGTGLGLSVSYGIIKFHNGEICVESQPGEGATFTVLLPIKAEIR